MCTSSRYLAYSACWRAGVVVSLDSGQGLPVGIQQDRYYSLDVELVGDFLLTDVIPLSFW